LVYYDKIHACWKSKGVPIYLQATHWQPAPQAPDTVAEPVASDSYVQPVPDHCNRITWRNRYYHLPLQPCAEAIRQAKVEAYEQCLRLCQSVQAIESSMLEQCPGWSAATHAAELVETAMEIAKK
jgi:hypothetical protein